jgi:hypothetical protein
MPYCGRCLNVVRWGGRQKQGGPRIFRMDPRRNAVAIAPRLCLLTIATDGNASLPALCRRLLNFDS